MSLLPNMPTGSGVARSPNVLGLKTILSVECVFHKEGGGGGGDIPGLPHPNNHIHMFKCVQMCP